MVDMPIQQFPVTWRVQPPSEIERGTLFTVVAQINYKVEPLVVEAFPLSSSGEVLERFYGNTIHTGPGFNDDGVESTYIWFNMLARMKGTQKLQFRLSWRLGCHMYGSSDIFEIKVHKKHPPPFYCTDDQDLLALLEPEFYDPTPIELMVENA
ncbi:hypothetical protein ONZ43_g99 [Nemania bipapillata]|uniref:Uncharacterized protein n=1 Tax=Nemania bipapillata TaxID=110536 RepID=A0ACC2J9U6_9PEZI|nr:hypothetical protein ONZ43_g99 [Nemania bipapillata]